MTRIWPVLVLAAFSGACIGEGGGGGGGDDDDDTGGIPHSLELIGSREYASNTVYGVAIDAGRSVAFVAGDFPLEVLDIGDPSDIALLDTSTSPIAPEDVEVSGTTLYVADLSDIRVYDASDPAALMQQPLVPRLDSVYGLTASGNRLYSSEFGAGLAAWDLSSPLSPMLLSTADTPGSTYSIVVADGFGYVGDGLEGLRVVELGDGTGLTGRGFLPAPMDSICGTRYLGCHGSVCLLSQCFSDPQVADVSDPDAPAVIGTFSVGGSTTRAWMGDGYGILARGKSLLLIDLRDPTQPEILDELSLGQLAELDVSDLDVDGELVAVGADSGFALLRLVGGSAGAAAISTPEF